MRKLNARLATWQRYARKSYWNPRVTGPRWMRPGSATACSPGHTRAWNAREHERERRQCHQFYTGPCFECGLPDLHNGDGDGIGSCDCTRCEDCGSGPGCECDWAREDDWPDDDAGHGDDWPADVIVIPAIETVDTGGLT